MKWIKSYTVLLLSFSLMFLVACGKAESEANVESLVTIPDVVNIELTDGKSVLTNMGLLPVIEYEFSDSIEKDKIVRTNPSIGSDVDENSKITLYVSKGPSLIHSKDSVITWYNISNQQDDWQFSSPYISENILYIECYDVIFGSAMIWEDRYNEGFGFGTASVNDTFDKVVPVDIKYEKQSYGAGEAQSFTLIVPLSDLEVDKPTDLYLRLGAKVNGNYKEININFSITW